MKREEKIKVFSKIIDINELITKLKKAKALLNCNRGNYAGNFYNSNYGHINEIFFTKDEVFPKIDKRIEELEIELDELLKKVEN